MSYVQNSKKTKQHQARLLNTESLKKAKLDAKTPTALVLINNDDNRKPAATMTEQKNTTKQGAVKVVDGLTANNSTVHINNYIITSAVPAQVLRDVVEKKD